MRSQTVLSIYVVAILKHLTQQHLFTVQQRYLFVFCGVLSDETLSFSNNHFSLHTLKTG